MAETASKGKLHAMQAAVKSKGRIGDVLVEQGKLSRETLLEAMRLKSKERIQLGQALIKLGVLEEDDIALAVAESQGHEYVDLEEQYVEPGLATFVPQAIANRYRLVPIKNGEVFEIAMDRPPAMQVRRNLERIVKKPVKIKIAATSKIQDALSNLYNKSSVVAAEDKSTVETVSGMIEEAIRTKASDIHLEPFEDRVRLRYRVDGMLKEIARYEVGMLPALTSRIKVMAGLNIAERRSPQDGALVYEHLNEEFDLRVSTLPTTHGEKVVMRILSGEGSRLTLDQIGLSDRDFGVFKTLIKRPYGIILIVGPTGSGKSTTLCAALNTINAPDINITTVEDPVEYKIDGVNQVHVGKSDKISFASALRSILRQDPDVIMVGETRDTETATISLRAALTGHLVFTTLHTNDAAGALPRLVDMGCEPFLVGASVSGILAQRLVRRLCPKCKRAYEPSGEEMLSLGLSADGPKPMWYAPVGCAQCMKTGYKGRIGVFEMLAVDELVRKEVVHGGDSGSIREAAKKGGMKTLREDAVAKVFQGVTSVDEVLRVTIRT
jgi:type IV pilus assembly protein PilB